MAGRTEMRPSFREALQSLIHSYSKENESGTPDFILAAYLEACLAAFDQVVIARNKWYKGIDQAFQEHLDFIKSQEDKSDE